MRFLGEKWQVRQWFNQSFDLSLTEHVCISLAKGKILQLKVVAVMALQNITRNETQCLIVSAPKFQVGIVLVIGPEGVKEKLLASLQNFKPSHSY